MKLNLQKEIEYARARNYTTLVQETYDKICNERSKDIDVFIHMLNGDYMAEAVDIVASNIKAGMYDKMLIPIENNK